MTSRLASAATQPLEISRDDWDEFLRRHPRAHLLQTAAWGDLKAAFGWTVSRIREGEAGAQVLFRRLPLGLRLAYVPKGPLGDWLPGLLPALDALCRARGAFALKVEPDAPDGDPRAGDPGRYGFVPSAHSIQPRRTLVVSLKGDEDDLLSRMHQKTRYNIRLSERKGVRVRPWDDLESFGRMIQETAARDRFGAHTPAYYRHAYELFRPQGGCELFVAEADGVPLAGLMAFAHGPRALYLYGASRAAERQRMPNYLLQWEAMRWARARGCEEYDLWGVPDRELDELEAGFASRSDGLWGVYRFKRGFGGDLVRWMGAWDRPYARTPFAFYRWLTRRIRD